MLVGGHLVEWLILAKCVTLLKYCVNKKKNNNQTADLNLHWAHMSVGIFSDVVAHTASFHYR